MSSCPNSAETGCRCVEHDLGLARYARDPEAYERMLAKARGTAKLRVVTPEPAPTTAKSFDGVIPLEKPCSGSMLCDCKKCETDKAQRVAKPRADVHQPWQPRRPRQERIAA